MRPGMKDPRVVALRKRLDIAGDKDSPLYDDAVRDAVKAFQTGADLDADGNVGPQHRARAQRRAAGQARLRPIRSTPSSSIWSAGAGCRAISAIRTSSSTCRTTRLTLYNDGKVFWHTKIVAGKPAKRRRWSARR